MASRVVPPTRTERAPPRRGRPVGFLAVRHQGIRPLTRRNTFCAEAFFETDAGLSWAFRWGALSVVGRNLGDSRHDVADSEVGDGQFYVAPPRRFLAEATIRS